MSSQLSINNIKITIKTDVPFYPCNDKVQIKDKIYAVKVYSTNPLFINVTGLKSFDDIATIRAFLTTNIISPSNILRVQVDSIFASRRLASGTRYNMKSIAKYCETHCQKDYFVEFSQESSSSKCLLLPRIKRREKNNTNGKNTLKQVDSENLRRPPQITLFYTGSVTVMGIRSLNQIDKLNQLINQIYQDVFKYKNTNSND